MHANYFEGVLQLRNPTKEIFDFIESEMQKKGNVFITKKRKMKDGFDLYITDQHFLQILGKKMQQKFGGEMKLSETLFSRSKITSRDVFRINIYYKYFSARVGEIKDYRGEKVKIIKMGRSKVTVKDCNGRNMFVEYCDLK